MTAPRTERLDAEYLRRTGSKDKGFCYLHPDGSRLRDAAQLERIARLAVPPGYKDVWVAPDADAELRAFGRDAKACSTAITRISCTATSARNGLG